MRLPLKWARIGFVLIVACLGTMLLSFFAPTLRLLFLGFGLALVLACIGIYIRFHYLRGGRLPAPVGSGREVPLPHLRRDVPL